MRYPSGIIKKNNNPLTYSNRGMGLEEDINTTNEYYRTMDKAIIYKKPTPITIVKVDYPSRLEAVIKEAYFRTPSTTDYNGIYKGKYIDFEAKETKSTTSFPLSNIHPHQIKHLENIVKHGGIGFIIVRFTKLNNTFLLLEDDLIDYINSTSKSSIPYKYFQDKGYLIKEKYEPRLDYLEVLNNIYGGKLWIN